MKYYGAVNFSQSDRMVAVTVSGRSNPTEGCICLAIFGWTVHFRNVSYELQYRKLAGSTVILREFDSHRSDGLFG